MKYLSMDSPVIGRHTGFIRNANARPLASIRYTLAQPIRLRGIIAVGAVTGLMLGRIAWACLIG